MASTDLLLSSPTAGDRQKGTISVWVKRTAIETNGYLYSTWNTSAGGYSSGLLQFTGSTDQLVFTNYQANGGSHTELKTNRRFRDMNCWYNICVNWDTTLATSSDRYKIFINGVRETSFATATYPSQNENLFFDIGGANNPIRIGSVQGTSAYLDAVLSHYHKVDGTAYDASTFGETDSTTGEWKIKTSPSLTYGSGSGNFFIFKDGTNLSGSTVQDQSGEGNDLTVDGGTLTKTEDCPSNVFATFNPLEYHGSDGATLSNGNTTYATPSAGHRYLRSTLGANKGKWYAEFKVVSSAGAGTDVVGITDHEMVDGTDELSQDADSIGYVNDGSVRKDASNVDTGESTYTTGDIIGVAMDLDNSKIYFHKNGTYINSGNPSSSSNGYSIDAVSTTATGFYAFAAGDWVGNAGGTYSANFGNGYFGTTQITSEGTNASNVGKFEYDVPTNYTSLSTKGLNI